MASSSRRVVCTPEEIAELITGNDSDDDFLSDSDEDYQLGSSESEESSDDSSSTIEEPVPKRRRPNRQSTPVDQDAWKKGNFTPVLFDFLPLYSGISPGTNITEESTESDFFKLIFTEAFVADIVRETNEFLFFASNSMTVKEHSRMQNWKDTDVKELYTFFALYLLTSHQRKLSLKDYWSRDPLLATPFFGQVMPANRFLLLLRFLHFSDNSVDSEGNKLFKLQFVITHLRKVFSELLCPYKNLCIDESLVLWKGRLSFKQYIPSKRHRFGIKLFVLCDVKTGYVLDFIVYTGSDTDYEDLVTDSGKSGKIVLNLLKPYLDKGYSLYVDNWYSSPALFQELHKKKTGACGTAKVNRKEMPRDFPAKMKKGEHASRITDKMLAVKWHDRRDVHMLTTINKDEMKPSGKKHRDTNEDIMKPECVLDYNRNMGSVDKTDLQLSSIECSRKTMKWYKKLFFHLMDLSVLNAYYLYKEAKKKHKLNFSVFRLELIRQLLGEYSEPRKNPKGGRPSSGENPTRLTDRHFPSMVPATEKKKNASRTCRVCSHTSQGPKKRKETRYQCKTCDVGLCVVPCFEQYHTLLNY